MRRDLSVNLVIDLVGMFERQKACSRLPTIVEHHRDKYELDGRQFPNAFLGLPNIDGPGNMHES